MHLVTHSVDPVHIFHACIVSRRLRQLNPSGWTPKRQTLTLPVKHGNLILDVVLFAFQRFLRNALDSHQPLGPLLLG